MSICPTCERPVYFAERVTSIGKDWHRPCLRCYNSACKKTLSAGSHSEHDGKPYCNRCYGALFGPRGYGHGGVESHVFLNGTTGVTTASTKTALNAKPPKPNTPPPTPVKPKPMSAAAAVAMWRYNSRSAEK